jgi:hypothetical protein
MLQIITIIEQCIIICGPNKNPPHVSVADDMYIVVLIIL